MDFFKDCAQCELFILGIVFLVGILIDYVLCKKRKWGENPKRIKWWK